MNGKMDIQPVTLAGEFIRLEPLSQTHHAQLAQVGLDEDLWRWIPQPVRTPEEMHVYISTALDDLARGVSLPFATIEQASGRAIGSTRFGNIDRANRHVEIGWTWLARPWQRTRANTEAKYLMLRHAFDTWGANRVELKTDALNERSRNAILRIGARQEGIFRSHMVTSTGRLRDTVYFSIVSSEWPEVKARLELNLAGK
jgi:N-acetyltransferase